MSETPLHVEPESDDRMTRLSAAFPRERIYGILFALAVNGLFVLLLLVFVPRTLERAGEPDVIDLLILTDQAPAAPEQDAPEEETPPAEEPKAESEPEPVPDEDAEPVPAEEAPVEPVPAPVESAAIEPEEEDEEDAAPANTRDDVFAGSPLVSDGPVSPITPELNWAPRGSTRGVLRTIFCMSSSAANREVGDCPVGPDPNGLPLAQYGTMPPDLPARFGVNLTPEQIRERFGVRTARPGQITTFDRPTPSDMTQGAADGMRDRLPASMPDPTDGN
jgi:hypothetical protein